MSVGAFIATAVCVYCLARFVWLFCFAFAVFIVYGVLGAFIVNAVCCLVRLRFRAHALFEFMFCCEIVVFTVGVFTFHCVWCSFNVWRLEFSVFMA